MLSRRQTSWGRSQSPVVWIAEEMETKPSKPIDKASLGEVTSHRAVTTVNALWPRKALRGTLIVAAWAGFAVRLRGRWSLWGHMY